MNEHYNRKNIRNLLMEGFSEEELRSDLCFYETDFQSLHHRLPQGVGKDVIVQTILDFALQKIQVNELLEWAKARNPVRYEKHGPYIQSEQVPNEDNIVGSMLEKTSDVQSQPRILLASQQSPFNPNILSEFLTGTEPNFLHIVWDLLDANLQDALSMAYNQSRREGKDRISTTRFLAAIRRLQPEPLPDLLNFLPKDSLPTPIDKDITTEMMILHSNPLLSSCVGGSLRHLGEQASYQNQLSSADVFVDIAKYGVSPAVKRLRTYGVTADKIDRIVDQLGWKLHRR